MASSKKPNQTSLGGAGCKASPGLDATKLIQTYSGTGKHFNVKFVGCVDVDVKKDKVQTICRLAMQTLKVTAQRKKFKKEKHILGLTLKGLAIMNENDRSISRIALEKVFYVSHDQEDLRYFGLVVIFKGSHTGHKLYTFKSELKTAKAFVGSCSELFHLKVQIKKAKELVKKQHIIEKKQTSLISPQHLQQHQQTDLKLGGNTVEITKLANPPPQPSSREDQPPSYLDIVHTIPAQNFSSSSSALSEAIRPTLVGGSTTENTVKITPELDSQPIVSHPLGNNVELYDPVPKEFSNPEQHSSSTIDDQGMIEKYDDFALGQVQSQLTRRDSACSSSDEEDFAEIYAEIAPHLIRQLQIIPAPPAAVTLPPSLPQTTAQENTQRGRTVQNEIAEKKKRELEELKQENRMKSIKKLKQFNLPKELECLFTVEMTESNPKKKENLEVIKGERISVIVASHAKLPRGKYLAEKEDGTLGFVDASKTKKAIKAEALSEIQDKITSGSIERQQPPPAPPVPTLSPASSNPHPLHADIPPPQPPPLPPPRQSSISSTNSLPTSSSNSDTRSTLDNASSLSSHAPLPSERVKTSAASKPPPIPPEKPVSESSKPSLPLPSGHKQNHNLHQPKIQGMSPGVSPTRHVPPQPVTAAHHPVYVAPIPAKHQPSSSTHLQTTDFSKPSLPPKRYNPPANTSLSSTPPPIPPHS